MRSEMRKIRNVGRWIVRRSPASVRWQVSNLKGWVTMQRRGLEPPPPMSVPNEAFRLYIGPANYAGQGTAWAQAVTQLMPNVAAANMAIVSTSDYLRYPSSYSVAEPIYAGSRQWNNCHREAMLGFTHVLIEAFIPNVRNRRYSDVLREAEWLNRSGVSVAWMCHGTEIRLPSRHRALEPWSPYVETAGEDRRVLRNLRIVHDNDLPVFVSTPDLLIDVPRAKWCPVVVDPDSWHTDPSNAPLGHDRLRVFHPPTNRAIKGTDLVMPTLRRLQEEGVVDLELVEGVPNAEMAGRLARADVVIDQFRIGSYGVFACEAMAAGRVVVSHVSDQVRQVVRQQTGHEIPIVEATPDSLESVLRGILNDRESALYAAKSGPEFVSAVHDGRLSASALSSLFTGDPVAW